MYGLFFLNIPCVNSCLQIEVKGKRPFNTTTLNNALGLHLSFLAVPCVQWFLILIPLRNGTVSKSNTYDVWDLKCRITSRFLSPTNALFY